MKILLFILLSFSLSAQTVNFPTPATSSPASPSRSVQFNNGGAVGGAVSLASDGDNLRILQQSSTSVATSTSIPIFANSNRPYQIIADILGSNPFSLKKGMGSVGKSELLATGTGVTSIGLSASLSGASTTHSLPTTGSAFNYCKKITMTSSTAANSIASATTSANILIGDTNYGGFYYSIVGAATGNPSNQLFLMGVSSSATSTSTTIVTDILNFIGVGYATGDANYSLIYNDGSGTTTKTDLGSNFPTSTGTQAWLHVSLWAPFGGGSVSYLIKNLTNGSISSGTLSTNIPSGSTALGAYVLTNCLSSGAGATFAISNIVQESTL